MFSNLIQNAITHSARAVKLDPKDEANYQMVEACTEAKASGVVVGVRCERGRMRRVSLR